MSAEKAVVEKQQCNAVAAPTLIAQNNIRDCELGASSPLSSCHRVGAWLLVGRDVWQESRFLEQIDAVKDELELFGTVMNGSAGLPHYLVQAMRWCTRHFPASR